MLLVVQSLSHVQFFETLWTTVSQAPLSSTTSWSLLKFKSIELVMLPNHLILCHPFSFWLQSCPASESFSSESALPTRWPKYWNFSFSNSPINIQHWFLLRLTDLISLLSKGLSRVFSRTTIRKHHWWIKCKIQIKTETFLLLYSDPIHSFYFPPQISPLPLK